MTRPHDFGRGAEQRAADLLERAGWRVLHRNWRWRHKEIDLVARRGDIVAFVEVKARHRAEYGHPLDAITWSKRRDLEAAARGWIAQHGQPADLYRFDAVWLLETTRGSNLEHIEDAWQL
jgi:putative endonuclease